MYEIMSSRFGDKQTEKILFNLIWSNTMTKQVFKVKRKITLPLIKPAIDVPVYVKIDEPIFVGKQIGDKDAAILANVTDLETGESAQIIIPSVLQGILHDGFGAAKFGAKEKGGAVVELVAASSNDYVGKGFMLTKHKKASGKQYNPYSVAELEL